MEEAEHINMNDLLILAIWGMKTREIKNQENLKYFHLSFKV